MPCYYPQPAYRTASGDVVFVERSRFDIVDALWLSCGQCFGCRLERSRQWAVRCLHEASLYKRNCFVTFTYRPETLPADGSLTYDHFQSFMKRLRWHFPKDRIRFYMCGEYGEETHRPHYHALMFNFDFPDKEYYKKGSDGSKLYKSAILEKLWRLGDCVVGEMTFESAAYVARYVMKKWTGAYKDGYDVLDPDTGEVVKWKPEFTNMSRKPGIGARWYEKFKSDVYPSGMVVVRGKEARPPRFYDRRFKEDDPDGYAELCLARENFSADRVGDNTPERLAVRETVARAASQTPRSL